jgi:hypothetical protein
MEMENNLPCVPVFESLEELLAAFAPETTEVEEN